MQIEQARKSSQVPTRGLALLQDPTLNRGTAFTEGERDALGLRGLLPPHVLSQDEQATRVLINLRRLADPLDKFVALNSLHDRNEALFFRVLCDHIDEMQPLVYTPDRRPRVPEVRPHFSAPARPFHRRQRSRPHRAGAAQLAPSGAADRRHRRRADTGAWGSRRQRHGHTGGQAIAVYRLRRRASAICACRSRSTSAPTMKRCSKTRFM